jgi:hypothetical protein
MEDGRFVPWIAYSPPVRTMAAAPMGLDATPPGIRSGRRGLSRFTSAGGLQAGLMNFATMRADPAHCLPALPTPTG